VGQDAALDKNRAAFQSLVAAGHEVGNHSLSHEPWFHEYTDDQVTKEIAEAEEHIERATGLRPRGFRGPGFSLTPHTLRVLAGRGYLFDASTFPTFLGPLARAFYFWNTRDMSEEDRRKRRNLYGGAKEGLRPIRPYLWDVPGAAPLVELPVTTMPLARMPIHMSYILYAAGRSRALALGYLRAALELCRLTRVEPSFLLHPLDFLGKDKVAELAFFPGMNVDTGFKLDLFDSIVGELASRFELCPMGVHVAALLDRGTLEKRQLS